MSWVAYADESIRTGDGVYILAAATLDIADVEETRAAICSLAPRPGHRFHWHEQDARRRLAAVRHIGTLGFIHIVVIGAQAKKHGQERARRICMESLLFHLESAGVEHLCLESRNSVLDRRDFDVIAGFRARRIVTTNIRIDHACPEDEPLLWAADLVAGVANAAEGGDIRYWQVLAGTIAEYRVTLT